MDTHNNYVYTYQNPISKEVFYVGRGINNRITDRNHNAEVMLEVHSLECKGFIFKEGYETSICIKEKINLTKDQAKYLEAKLIKLHGIDRLKNIKQEHKDITILEIPETLNTINMSMVTLNNYSIRGCDLKTEEEIKEAVDKTPVIGSKFNNSLKLTQNEMVFRILGLFPGIKFTPRRLSEFLYFAYEEQYISKAENILISNSLKNENRTIIGQITAEISSNHNQILKNHKHIHLSRRPMEFWYDNFKLNENMAIKK